MFRQQQQPQQPDIDLKGAFNVFYLVFAGLATTVTTFTRRDFGKEALGVAGLAGFVFILVYGAVMHVPEMIIYLGVWMVSVLVQRARQFRMWLDKRIVHSRYGGYPWLGFRLNRKAKTEVKAKEAEALFVIVAGGLLTQASLGVGLYVVLAGVAAVFVECLHVETRKKQLQDMTDAEIEQRALAEDYQQYRRF